MRFWAIVQKDLLLLLRDRRALAVLLAMPLVLVGIVGLTTGQLFGWTDESTRIGLLVVDEAGSELSGSLVRDLLGCEAMQAKIAADYQQARVLVGEQTAEASVTIGREFDQRVAALSAADVLDLDAGQLAGGLEALDMRLYCRPTSIVQRAVIEQLIFGQALRLISPIVAQRDPAARELLLAGNRPESTVPPQAPIVPVHFGRHYGNVVYQVLVPSFAVMFAFLLINVMARSFIAERELGTLMRLRTAPIGPAAVVLGKTVPFFLVSVAQGGILLVCGKVLFGMSWGPYPWLLMPVVICTGMAATGFGLLVAVWVRSDAEVTAFANLLVIVLAGVSGCFMPRDWLPETLRQISLATPHAWALIAYDQLLASKRPDLAPVYLSCAVLVGFAAVLFMLAGLRFRKLATQSN